jgi:hypothetical protein
MREKRQARGKRGRKTLKFAMLQLRAFSSNPAGALAEFVHCLAAARDESVKR